MSAHKAFMRLHGARMLDAGYHILPIAPGQKYPAQYANGRWEPMAGWSRFAHMKPPEQLVDIWANWPGCGVGIVTGGRTGVIGVDVDILDEALAARVKGIIQEHLGPSPLIRVGKAPKLMMLYRTASPMSKISLQPIEVLATGQQFVAYGVHPDTGLDYHWPNESPDDTLVSSIAVATEEAVRLAIKEAYGIIPSELKPTRLTASEERQNVVGSNSETAPATIEAITETLQAIPNNDVQWDDWKRILMATFVASRGSEQAYFEFLAWSRKSSKHNDATTRAAWNGCKSSVPKRIDFGTLHYIAKQHGWIPSSGLQFNEEKRAAAQADTSAFDDMPIERAQTVHNYTRLKDIIAAKPDQKLELLRAAGVQFQTNYNPQTGEIFETMYPNNGNMALPESVGSALEVIYEDNKNLFATATPKILRLTQDEIENGSLPRMFVNEFPQEWLFTSSLIGRIAHWVDSACLYPHRLYALMSAFTMFGAIVGRQYRTQSDLRPSLSVCTIGKTGSGKEHPRKAVTKLMLAAGAAKHIGPRGGFSSGSGVVEGLQNQPSMWLAVDEFGKKIAAYGKKGDQNQREMIAMFLEAVANDYIGGKGYANSKENTTRNVQYPNLNIYGSSQIEEITASLSSAAAADGFIQRFLFVPTFADYVPMRENFTRPIVPEPIVDEIKAVMSFLSALGGDMATNEDPSSEPNMILVEMTKQADELWKELDKRRLSLLKAGRHMWVRSPAQTIKIAMLEAIACDHVKPVITAEGLDSARKLVDWFTRYSETYIASNIADNEVERDLKKIRAIIADGGESGVPRWLLNRKTPHLTPRQRDEILKNLLDGHEIEEQMIADKEGLAGRPKKIFRILSDFI